VIQSVLSTASYRPEVSPGEFVSIIGQHLGPSPVTTQFDSTGAYPTVIHAVNNGPPSIGDTTVTFDGVPAALLYLSPTQINAIVPYSVAGKSSTTVVVTHYGNTSTLRVPVTATSPGIFTAAQTGTGQAAIYQYSPSPSVNTNANPASAGDSIVFFATGAGVWNPSVLDATVSVAPTNFTTQPVSLTIGGNPAQIVYAGASPFQSWGLLQVNAIVPAGTPSGAQPLVVKVGNSDNSSQNVTIAVK
jgi:uncharacterized protein (TIGR03437 family)